MRIEDIRDSCTGCSACYSSCPKGAIEIKFDEEGYYYPYIDKSKCIQCNLCENNCHILNTKTENKRRTTYYGWTRDPFYRSLSSSGGIFSALAQTVINQGGIVFGAYFNFETMRLEHKSSSDVRLEDLCKSKYLESNVAGSFKEVKRLIVNNKKVLYCGTPCQIAGLKMYCRNLKNVDDRLLTVDFICHGVPSMMLFQQHMKHIIKQDETVYDISFRQKEKGWSSKYLYFRTNKRINFKPYMYDSFYAGFLKDNVLLRRSCYECQYRQSHVADITLADFWGYREYDESIFTEKGVSLMITNTELGEKIMNDVAQVAQVYKIDNHYSDYVYKNKDYLGARSLRDSFYEYYRKYGFEKAAYKIYMNQIDHSYSFYVAKTLIKRILKR